MSYVPAPSGVAGIGVDLVDISRFERILDRRPALAARLFSAEELGYASGLARPAPTLAGRFAVKEAVMKALGVGIGAIDWTDVSVARLPGGRPRLGVAGRAARLAAERGVAGWQVSISHTDTVACAMVVAVG
ncbi:MAG TPA: holo-ACP synthase [Acidimicrobiales bacterium]|nr:holo-ACP synthase [Acidimicrobiales bacterium]